MSPSPRNTRSAARVAGVRIVSTEQVFDEMKHVFDRIASRAYEIFEANGREQGSDLRNWYLAEAEILRPVQVDIFDSEDNLTLRAEVRDFRARELQIGLEPGRFTIAGAHGAARDNSGKSSRRRKQAPTYLFHSAPLPHEVDTARAKVTLDGGILLLNLTKVASAGQPATRAMAAAAS